MTLYFSLIVMYDAAGLRRAAGRQAAILNRLIDEHFQHPEAETQRLMELLGHTPLEVLVGALLGVAQRAALALDPLMSLLERIHSPADLKALVARRARPRSPPRSATSSSRPWRATPATWRPTSAWSS